MTLKSSVSPCLDECLIPNLSPFGNPAQFVVLELGRARPLVGTVGQVAGAVVAVAAFDGGLAIARRYLGFAFAGFRQIVEGGDLPFMPRSCAKFEVFA